MDFGIDDADPFGVGALFVAQSLGHKFECVDDVRWLVGELIALETPQLPGLDPAEVVAPVDALLDRIEPHPVLVDFVHALLELGTHTPPRTEVSQRLYRAVQWTMMRHDPGAVTPEVLDMLRSATPGARWQPPDWPRHEFFAAVLVLVYLGGPPARVELADIRDAARDLGYHDLAPVLDWYLDHEPDVPLRA